LTSPRNQDFQLAFIELIQAPAISQAIGIAMAHAFIIEVRSRAAGIVVRDGRLFRFHAASDDFNGLDGRGFRSPGEAQKAAIRHAEDSTTGRVGGRALRLQSA